MEIFLKTDLIIYLKLHGKPYQIKINKYTLDVLEGLQACIVTGKGKQLTTQIGYQPF